MSDIYAADLFCGAGGTSSGLAEAVQEMGHEIDLVAVNHWPVAVQSHWANFPWARHICQNLQAVKPGKAVPGRKLNILVASPECTHFSSARGGKPMSDQQRSSPKEILKWLDEIDVENFMIENVREFQTWGPLYKKGPKKGKPIPSRKGLYYNWFITELKKRGYRVEAKILNAADYGDATTRQRLFILGKKGDREIKWPKVSHPREKWRAAKEIIDWSIKGESIFTRKRPLKNTTIARIAAGLRKFGGKELEPFLVMLYGTNDARSLERPLPTVTANGQHIALCEPFILQQQSGGVPRAVSQPLPTVATKGAQALVQPMLFKVTEGNGNGKSADGKVVNGKPFIVPFFGERKGQDPRTHSVDEPLPAVTGHGAGALVESFIIPVNHGKGDKRAHSVDEPMRTITGVDAWALIQPFLVKYFGTATARPITEPLDTITTKDRFALVEPKRDATGYVLDIHFRMLQPKELAAAMSFDDDYQFSGTRSAIVKQIGNAVPKRTAKALVKALLSN